MKRIVSFLLVLCLFILLPVPALAKTGRCTMQEASTSVYRIFVYDTNGKAVSAGSAFAIAADDHGVTHLLTNAHVIDANRQDIRLFLNQSYEIPCTLAAVYEDLDLAVLELTQPLANGIALPLGDASMAKAGDDVYAMGFPQVEISDFATGYSEDVVITKGVISKKTTWNGVGYYQTDASVNSGNSGGPLLHADGYVIGVNTIKLKDAEGVVGAVMIDEILPHLQGIAYITASSHSTQGILHVLFVVILVLLSLAVLVLLSLLLIYILNRRLFNAIMQALPVLLGQTEEKEADEWEDEELFPCLVGISGQYKDALLQMTPQTDMVIGRDVSRCALVYPEDMTQISRVHCALSYDRETSAFKLEDFSRFGTYLDGDIRVHPGDPARIMSGTRFYLSDRKEAFAVCLFTENEIREREED